jgi:hypothetical protein
MKVYCDRSIIKGIDDDAKKKNFVVASKQKEHDNRNDKSNPPWKYEY